MVQSLPQSDGFRVLFNSPELSEVQRSGFHFFLRKGIAEELSKISCIQIKTVSFLVEISIDAQNFRLVAPENNYRDCILKMKSYTCKLYVQVKIFFKDKISGELLYQTQPEWVLLADLPMMTKRGHFVINGSPRIVVHQVGRAPGIYFKKILKVKKDISNQARFYGDIIPRKGVWVRLQTTKKGEIDLKLKTSKKVRAEMVQKCLELLEKEESVKTGQSYNKIHLNRSHNPSSAVTESSFCHATTFVKANTLQNFVLHALQKQSFCKQLDFATTSPSLVQDSPIFINSEVNLKPTFRQSPVLTQKQLFLNPQTLLLVGVNVNNCFSSKTRQTQAFVIGFRKNHSKIMYGESKTLCKAETSDNKTFGESFIMPSPNLNKLLPEYDSGKLSYAFTKTEKEAFANVYTSFYKNEIQDLEERVSMPLSRKPENSSTNLFSITELPIELKDKFSKKTQYSKKKRSAKKQNIVNNLEKVREYLYQLFKRSDLYDLGSVGREKINTKFGISVIETQLTALDIKEAINWLSKLRAGREETDDIDHSQNRRIRTSSELIQTQFSIGISRLKNLVTKKVRNGKDEQIKTSIYKQTYAKQSFSGDEFVNKTLTSSLHKRDNEKENKAITKPLQNLTKTCNKNEVFVQFLLQVIKKRSFFNLTHEVLLPLCFPFAMDAVSGNVRTISYRAPICYRNVNLVNQSSTIDPFFSMINSCKNQVILPNKAKSSLVKTKKLNVRSGTLFPQLKVKQNCEYNPVFKHRELFDVSYSNLYLAIIFVKSNFGLQTVKVLPKMKMSFEILPKTKFLANKNHLHKLQVKSKQFCSTLLTRFFGDVLQRKLENRSTSQKKEENHVSLDHVFHFKMASSCFVKNNKVIDNLKLHSENRITFTSINPYFVTFQKKRRFCLSWSKLKDTREKLRRRPKHTTFVVPAQASLYKSFAERDLLQIKNKAFVTKTGSFCNKARDDEKLLSNFSISEWFSTKPINGALREFFSSSPLSQYMDQTNPLAEVTHKRRLSSLGIGGVSRESAGMTIRGIHPTHYGRICPIETPEGKNAGLVNSLAFYAKINDQGFIETPYYQVIKGQIQHELGFSFYSAGQESRNGLYIAPNDIKQSEKSKLLATTISTVDSIPVRVADNLLDLFKKVSPYQVDCIGISPVQILSVATSLIPFLEHNDANRALMGSNMQRQAVELMSSERPLVGTGLEARVLAESGHLVQSKVSGFVSNISAHQVVVQRLLHLGGGSILKKSTTKTEFSLQRLNGLFGLNVSPVTSLLRNFVLSSTTKQSCLQKLRFCKNLNKTFCYNVDLATTKSEAPVTAPIKPRFCYKFVMPSRTRKYGPVQPKYGRAFVIAEQNVNKAFTKRFVPIKLEQSQTWLTSFFGTKRLPKLVTHKTKVTKTGSFCYVTLGQQFLLKLDFNLTMPFNKSIVSDNVPFAKKKVALSPVTHSINTFSRSNQETCFTQKPLVEEGDWVQKGDMLSDCSAGQKGELSVGKNVLIAYIPWQGYNFEDAIVISDRLVKEQLYTSLHIERYTVVVNDFKDKVVDTNEWFTGNLPGVDIRKRSHLQKSGLPKIGTILREGDILVGKIKYSKKKPVTPHEKLVCDILGEHNFSVQNTSLYVPKGVHSARVLAYKIKTRFGGAEALKNNLRPAGAPKVVHLFLGEKRNIQVGDKMSGRHGNKGIVSTILPKQDMPYLADGSPIDILLNPLGVPSRMNVGQVFECLLGLASTYLHQNFKVTAFDELYGVEASQSLVFLKLYQARLQSGQNWLFQVNFPGKTRLTDGRSGECLDQWITVGRAYMLKLIHMVNEKIHARAIGPYALVTQQPLKGRAHKGGQRLGEMEVWAVEGFGAAYILQELLTKKSDDSVGRKEVLKAMLPKSTSDFLDPFGQMPYRSSAITKNFVKVIAKPSFATTNGLENILTMPSKQKNRVHSEDDFTVLGQPDIFKVLICELQALCLDVGVYSIKTESFQRQFVGVFE